VCRCLSVVVVEFICTCVVRLEKSELLVPCVELATMTLDEVCGGGERGLPLSRLFVGSSADFSGVHYV
jgi:hypothetical protein